MKKLYRFFWDYGRMGEIEGLFIATEEEINKILNKEIYFGEILGKHSNVFGEVKETDLTLLSEDQDFINKIEEIFKSTTLSGYNPLDYLDEEDEYGEEGDEE